MAAPESKKPVLTEAELEAKILQLVLMDKMNEAVMLMMKTKKVGQGVAQSFVNDVKRRASSR
ncbi:MAG: hypothetical protein NTY35_05840 [Planctomycetota bacterium]|nr:hypothetical protein [Planctomycetota bacterium]